MSRAEAPIREILRRLKPATLVCRRHHYVIVQLKNNSALLCGGAPR